MSDPPPLPGTDDPFELLDVARDADARTIRRAYTRLIRVYRAETHPAEFQRIRAAFESIRDGAPAPPPPVGGHEPVEPWTSPAPHFPEDDAAPEPTPLAPAEPPPPPEPDPWLATAAWEAAADGAFAQAREELARQARELGGGTAHVVHRFLLEELAGDDEAAERVLEEGLPDAPELCAWMNRVLDDETLARVAARDGLAWSRLLGQRDRAAMSEVFLVRCDELLLRRRIDRVLEEVAEPTFLPSSIEFPRLRAAPLAAACALLWEDFPRGREMFARFAGEVSRTGDDDDSAETQYLRVREAAQAWTGWDRHREAPEALRRFLQLRFVLERDVHRLHRALHADFTARPGDYAEFLAALAGSCEPAAQHLLEILELDAGTQGDPPELSSRASRELATTLDAIDHDLDRAGSNRATNYLGLLFFGLAIGSFFLIGWWGLLVLVVAFVGWGVVVSNVDGRLYRRRVRPVLIRLMARTPVHPKQLLPAISGRSATKTDLARLDDEVEGDDVTLRCAYAIACLHGDRHDADDENDPFV